MRRVLVPTVLLAIASALAACGSPSPAVTSTEPTTLPVVTTPVVTATASSTPTATSTATATALAACIPGQFEIDILNTQGAAGTIYATFEVRNTSTSDCTENGYAKVQMLTTGGGLLRTTWSNDNSIATPGPVDLPAGTEPLGAVGAKGHGYFLVSWTDATCSAAQAERPKFWRVILPSSRFQTDVTDVESSMVCGGAIKVGPIKPAPYP